MADDLTANLATIGQPDSTQSNDNTTINPAQSALPEPSWYFAEGIPGVGDKPDYLEPKYKTLADQAKAYKEAQKLLGTLKAAPEEYDFGEAQEYIDKENDHIQDFVRFAKDNKIQQDAFSKVLNTYVGYDKSRQSKPEEEIAKLGNDGMQKITTLQNWVRNNLSEGSMKALEKLPVKAEVVQMLDEVRQLHMNTLSKIPTETQKPKVNLVTRDEIEAEMLANYGRYQTDPQYRSQITAKFAQAIGTGKNDFD
jgi:hypothetical protein